MVYQPPARRPVGDARHRLERERDDAERLAGALATELDGIIDSVLHSNNDDEHDPDGATNGYERAKATALLDHARRRLVEIDRALHRLDDGSYEACERCGGDIGAERLAALATATRCAPCARAAPGP